MAAIEDILDNSVLFSIGTVGSYFVGKDSEIHGGREMMLPAHHQVTSRAPR